jgi:acyl-CoA synthetase (AMP-forming)/AMP-acid ligase II
MMDDPLDAWMLFEPGVTYAPDAEIVTRLPDGTVHRTTYRTLGARAQQLMNALDRLGLARDDRVATLAWNSYRHLEAYFAVPCTSRVLHTLNLRLSVDELAFIMADADDRVVLVDPDLLPLVEEIADRLPRLEHVVVLDSKVPATSLPGVIAYEDLIAGEPDSYPRSPIPETTPMGLCYTSGTTGRSKGVLYTHRSNVLHALAVTSGAGMSIGPGDCVLPQVPMFHANAWGMPYAAAMVGAKQVFFAGALEPQPFIDLLRTERVTVTAGVPTIWLSIADELAGQPPLTDLRHIVCGGAQPSRALITRYRDELDLSIVQAWGMTETSPLASMAWPQERMRDWPEEEVVIAARTQAGRPLPGVRISVRDDEGRPVPSDGASMGDLWVRGPWVTDAYLHGVGTDCFSPDGWFRTGDVAVASPSGYFVIADRTKDLIKSGGEWISSVDMESAIMDMDEVAEAAVVAVPDPKWQERPAAFIVLIPGASVADEAVRAHLATRGFARWQLPERIERTMAIPKTGVGKVDKKAIRAQLSPD